METDHRMETARQTNRMETDQIDHRLEIGQTDHHMEIDLAHHVHRETFSTQSWRSIVTDHMVDPFTAILIQYTITSYAMVVYYGMPDSKDG